MSPIENLIAGLPDWVSIPPDRWPDEAATANEGLDRARKALTRYDLDTIREGIETFVGSHPLTVEDAGRLLLFNRLVFAVPEWSDQTHFFGGFAGPKSEGAHLQIGWPLNTEGCLSHPFGGFFGDDFQALREFDRFRELFPRNAP